MEPLEQSLGQSSSFLSSRPRSPRSSFMGGNKPRSSFGRRSSIFVKRTVRDDEYFEKFPLGDVEMEGKGSQFLTKKALAVAEEKKQVMEYLEKKKVEMKLWDNLLQKYQCDLDEAKRNVHKELSCSDKEFSEEMISFPHRIVPSAIEVVRTMVLSLQKESQSQVAIEQLEAELAAARERKVRLDEALRLQKQFISTYPSRDELLDCKAKCVAVFMENRKWLEENGYLSLIEDSEKMLEAVTIS